MQEQEMTMEKGKLLVCRYSGAKPIPVVSVVLADDVPVHHLGWPRLRGMGCSSWL